MIVWFLALGCTDFGQSRPDLLVDVHDTVLTDLTIVGVRTQPVVPVWGEQTILTALAMGAPAVTSWTLELCGTEGGRPVSSLDCFSVSEEITLEGTYGALPIAFSTPLWADFPSQDCLDGEQWRFDTAFGWLTPPGDCPGPLHLRLTARGGDRMDQVVWTVPTIDTRYPDPGVLPLEALSLEATAGEPDQGVAVTAKVVLPEGFPLLSSTALQAHWRSDSGRFEKSGRTTGRMIGRTWVSDNILVDTMAATVTVVLSSVRRPFGPLGGADAAIVPDMVWTSVRAEAGL